ncbi:MAG TPA: hypothetical protein VEA69_09465 [Tepidisphaeraceae bacterium]|nr:hypothetical protein [Tepidisphaeraceae bacterium]
MRRIVNRPPPAVNRGRGTSAPRGGSGPRSIIRREDATFGEHATGFIIAFVGTCAVIAVGMQAGFAWGTMAAGVCGGGWWAWWRLVRRRHRSAVWINLGRCGGCGFDLRETPAVCPECGRAVPEDHRTHSDVLKNLEKMEHGE